jgi:FAD/FMN-containing dehydrogenase
MPSRHFPFCPTAVFGYFARDGSRRSSAGAGERMQKMVTADKTASIARQVKTMAQRREAITFTKNSVSHFVPDPDDPRQRKARVDLRGLNEILEIDVEAMTCTAESGVTFVDLARATLEKGLIPMTVPELKTITLGGAVSGCSVESMSFRFGGFHDTCLEYEYITGDGRVMTCSPEQDPDIFHMLHGSYGTLGILTKLKFRLVKALPFVRMTYHRFSRFEDFWAFLEPRCHAQQDDFIDAIVFAPDHFAACIGQMVDTAPYVSRYDREHVFYKSAKTRDEDYLATLDYFFRYDSDCHWLLKSMPVLENRMVRKVFGGMYLGSTNLIRWAGRLRRVLALKRRPDIVVDVFIPDHRFAEFFAWYAKSFHFYPLWIVPYRMPAVYPWVSDAVKERIGKIHMVIDCAIYGRPNHDPARDLSAELEEKVYEFDGVKTLISRNTYSRSRFWEIYDRPRYDAVKGRTDPDGFFENLYEKFHKDPPR